MTSSNEMNDQTAATGLECSARRSQARRRRRIWKLTVLAGAAAVVLAAFAAAPAAGQAQEQPQEVPQDVPPLVDPTPIELRTGTPADALPPTPTPAAPVAPSLPPQTKSPSRPVEAKPAPAANAPAASGSAPDQIIAQGLDANHQLRLMVNRHAVLNTSVPYAKVSTGQPEVADVTPVGTTSILVTAKKPGNTQLIVWDDDNRTQVVDVVVTFDLAALQEQYKSTFPAAEIQVSSLNGAISLRGRVPSLEVAQQVEEMAKPFAGKVLNFTEVSGGQQVSLAVKFAEVSRSASNQLGFNFGYSDGSSFAGSNIGQVSPLGIIPIGTAGSELAVNNPNPAVTIFGRGVFGDTAFVYFIAALKQNNLLRILAEPNLIAMSGKEASFLAGGEFPIPVTQGGGTGAGGTAVTIEWKEFGVRLKMTPVVLGGGRIHLVVNPEVSDLDFTTAVRFNGFVIPGLTTRKVRTEIELNEGQTFAIAGLLNNSVTSTKDVTPVLGEIPVLGALFRSVRYQRKETELVVLVTPHLVEGMNPGNIPPLPGEQWRDPNLGQLFIEGDLGGPITDGHGVPKYPSSTDKRPAAKYRGPYGYTPPSQTPGTGDAKSAVSSSAAAGAEK
jgi:pilus assembly protein CpaC